MYLLHCQVSHLIPRSLHQSSLDNAITHEPKQPVFTTAGLLDHLVELIVCEDEVCFLISGYVLLLMYLKGLPFSQPRPLSSSPQILLPLPHRKGYPSPKNSSGWDSTLRRHCWGKGLQEAKASSLQGLVYLWCVDFKAWGSISIHHWPLHRCSSWPAKWVGTQDRTAHIWGDQRSPHR